MGHGLRNRIGRRYLDPRPFDGENGPDVEADFRVIAAVNDRLFEAIPFVVRFTTEDPYPSARVMRERVYATGVVDIYTVSGAHPFLGEDENNVGRAVHDVFAHMVCGCPFTFEGEWNAYRTQRLHYPASTWESLYAEIPAQTAAYYAAGQSHDYPQRAFRAPFEWLLESVVMTRNYPDANPSLLRGLAA